MIDIRHRTTFGVPAQVSQLWKPSSFSEMKECCQELQTSEAEFFFLGGGSNLLFTAPFQGVAVAPNIPGIEILSQDEHTATVAVGASVVWHEFVLWTVSESLYGLENLGLIPGTVGAAPIQNIGAYGVEVQSSIVNVHTLDFAHNSKRIFSKEECLFGYRDSIFKRHKERFLVEKVFFRLDKKYSPQLSYAPLKKAFQGIAKPSACEVLEAVCTIRKQKLPDPNILGNAGSFFKNPVVSLDNYQSIRRQYPEIPAYSHPQGVKLAAGWLIEHSNAKKLSCGGAAVHEKQALVLVNKKNASGEDLLHLAQKIQEKVYHCFSISLEPEVRYIPELSNHWK